MFEVHFVHLFNVLLAAVQRKCTILINYLDLKISSINKWPSDVVMVIIKLESVKVKLPNLNWIIGAFELQTRRYSSLNDVTPYRTFLSHCVYVNIPAFVHI